MISIFEAIADDLATQSYAIADQFLSQTEVRSILSLKDFQNGQENFKKAGIGKLRHQINEGIRGDYIQWLERETAPAAVSVYFDRLEKLMHFLNQTLFLSLKDFEVHMTIYPEGAYYKRHLDQFKTDDHRKLSVICYLNERWEEGHGGHLRIYRPQGTADVLPVAGRLICFRSDKLEHEVLPATRERLSLTGWMLDRFADLRYL